MSESKHAILLNGLVEMQESKIYGVRKALLVEAERVIVMLEEENNALQRRVFELEKAIQQQGQQNES